MSTRLHKNGPIKVEGLQIEICNNLAKENDTNSASSSYQP